MPRPRLYSNKSEKTNIVLPVEVKKASRKLATAHRVSLSQLITQLLLRAAKEQS